MKKVIFCILICIALILFWINRIHPDIQKIFLFLVASILTWLGLKFFSKTKIQEIFVVTFATLIAAYLSMVFLTQDTDDIEKEVSQVYFKNPDGEIIFFDAPVLLHYHLQQNIIYGNFGRKNPEQVKGFFSNMPANANYLIELQAATLVDYLFQNYSHDWYRKREAKSFPGFNTIRGQRLDENNKDIDTFSVMDLKKVFEKNIFYPYLIAASSDVFKLSLPKGTKIKYQSYSDKNQYCQIQFYKPLCFDVKLKLYFSSYVQSLGNIAYYVGISEPQKKSSEPDISKGYGILVITMECTANFNKIRMGDPALIRYKKWIKNLFDDLYNTFDWAICDSEIRKYDEVLAHQKIVDNL